MHSYQYVPESEFKPVKENLIKLINLVQTSIKDTLKFRIKFIGSSSRDMITRDMKGNVGYDFDLNIIIDPNEKNYDPKSLKEFFMKSFNSHVGEYGYDPCEDSTSVFTIKVKDKINSKIIHSADFAIVKKVGGTKQFVRNRKDVNVYCWETLPKYPVKLSQMANWCREKNHWNEIRDLYLRKKNQNTDPNKKSRMIYAETVNDIYLKYNGK